MDGFFLSLLAILWWLSCSKAGTALMDAITTRIRCSAYHSLTETERQDRTRRSDPT